MKKLFIILSGIFLLHACSDSVGVGEGGTFESLGITSESVEIFNDLEDAGPSGFGDSTTNEASCDEGGKVRWSSSGTMNNQTVSFTYEDCGVEVQNPESCHDVEVTPGVHQMICDPLTEVLSGTRKWRISNNGQKSVWEDSSHISGSGDLGYLMDCDLVATTSVEDTTYSGDCNFSDSSGAEIVIPVASLEP